MQAKSTRVLLPAPHVARIRRGGRQLVSAVALIASVTVLGLIESDRYGHASKGGALGEALPWGALQPAPAGETAEPRLTRLRAERPADVQEGRYWALAQFLAKRYRVSQDVTLDFVAFAHGAGHQIGLDPLLIIAVIAVESRFNPIAESVAGAKGLMQVIPKYHPEKLEEFGGERAVFDPWTNIVVGAQILKEYLRRTGDLSTALQMYAGALSDVQDVYAAKVMNEKQRLQRVVNQSKGKSVRVAHVAPLGE